MLTKEAVMSDRSGAGAVAAHIKRRRVDTGVKRLPVGTLPSYIHGKMAGRPLPSDLGVGLEHVGLVGRSTCFECCDHMSSHGSTDVVLGRPTELGVASNWDRPDSAHYEAAQRNYLMMAPPGYDAHLRAKRDRVETIVRSMTSFPSELRSSPSQLNMGHNNNLNVSVLSNNSSASSSSSSSSSSGGGRESKRKQRLPRQQPSVVGPLLSNGRLSHPGERRRLQQKLRSMQTQLRSLQERFAHTFDGSDSDVGGSASERRSGPPSPESDNHREIGTPCVMTSSNDVTSQGQDFYGSSIKGWELAEALKQELSNTVSQVVDTVLTIFAPRSAVSCNTLVNGKRVVNQTLATREASVNPHAIEKSTTKVVNSVGTFTAFSDSPHNSPPASHDSQLEALSLVVPKAISNSVGPTTPTTTYTMPRFPIPLGAVLNFCSGQLQPCLPHPVMAYSLPGGSHPAAPPETNALEGELSSSHFRLLRHPMSLPFAGMSCSPKMAHDMVEGVPFPQVKAEAYGSQDYAEGNHYIDALSSEGLSPGHLKKAKLMFFYSRYPSSAVLKIYFPDVKFNRCITSQLIKWFSNFREFFYIQMEKFARQALSEGTTNSEELVVTQDSELFRSLNLHYNKSNDFQVPNRFLEVAEITLHEFFLAIQAGKDSDPSWKKAIYKITKTTMITGGTPARFKVHSLVAICREFGENVLVHDPSAHIIWILQYGELQDLGALGGLRKLLNSFVVRRHNPFCQSRGSWRSKNTERAWM